MATQTINQILDLIESVGSDEEVAGIVARYRDRLIDDDGTKSLIERLDSRRELHNRWKGLRAMIDHLRVRQSAAVRHQLEEATQAVIEAEGIEALGRVAERHPVVFTGTFLSSLMELHGAALQAGEDYTARMVQSRLSSLQMLQLAAMSRADATESGLRSLVYELLEAPSFGELLELIRDNPLCLASAFEAIMTRIGQEGASDGKRTLPKVVELRLAVTRGLHRVVETIVAKRPAVGGPDEAVEAFNRAKDAEQFLSVVARFPFVLGEDFGRILDREIQLAQADSQADAAAGIERRQGHLRTIGEIVSKLTQEAA